MCDGTIRGVLIELSDAELATAATACRALGFQEGERAKKMENPSMRRPVEHAAQRYAALAESPRRCARRSRAASSTLHSETATQEFITLAKQLRARTRVIEPLTKIVPRQQLASVAGGG